MHVAVYFALLFSLLFAAAGPALAPRHLSPRTGMWTLTLGAGLSAAASTWALVLLAATVLDEALPDAAERRFHNPVNDLVAATAVLLLGLGLVRLVHTLLTRTLLHRRLRACGSASRGPVVVLADPVPQAFALPGNGGRVVVSDGMLAALTADERRVLFAHERAHLRQRHHWHTAVAAAAAALNPLLIPTRGAARHLCERAADEAAAAHVGDRALAASALARAALAAAFPPSPATQRALLAGLHYHHTGIGARVTALRHEPARGRPTLAAPLLALVGAALTADLHATADFLHLFLRAFHIGL